VTITGVIEGEPERVELSTGEIFVRKKIPVGFTLELAVDQESNRRLIARKDHLLVKATGKKENSRWLVYVETPEHKIYYNDHDGSVGRGFVTDPDRNVPKPSHFDPLALGLMFAAEFNRGDSLASIVKNYSAWEKGFVRTEVEDGKSRFSRKIFDSKQDFFVVIDLEKGNWPVEMAVGDPPSIRQKLSIEKFKGVWLPKQTSFFHSDKTFKLDFEWHSVNQPLKDELFKLEDVKKTYSFQTKPN